MRRAHTHTHTLSTWKKKEIKRKIYQRARCSFAGPPKHRLHHHDEWSRWLWWWWWGGEGWDRGGIWNNFMQGKWSAIVRLWPAFFRSFLSQSPVGSSWERRNTPFNLLKISLYLRLILLLPLPPLPLPPFPPLPPLGTGNRFFFRALRSFFPFDRIFLVPWSARRSAATSSKIATARCHRLFFFFLAEFERISSIFTQNSTKFWKFYRVFAMVTRERIVYTQLNCMGVSKLDILP